MSDVLSKFLKEHIVKTGGKFELKSHKGKNLGKYSSKSGAEKRERQVQYFKHHSESADDDMKEGEATQSAGSLFGGPTGSIGETETSMRGFNAFTEAGVAPVMEATEDKPYHLMRNGKLFKKFKTEKEAETELRLEIKKDEDAKLRVDHFVDEAYNVLPAKRVKNGVTQYPIYNGKGELVWVTIPPRPQDEDTDGIVTEENDRIPRKPTRNRWFNTLVNTHKELPVRYRHFRDDFTAESGDGGTLHKIASFAHQHGLGTKLVKSPYDWDQTATLTITGFSKS